MKEEKRECYNCKYFIRDTYLNYDDCTNNDDNWTDNEVTKYWENSEGGCPHWKEDNCKII